MTGSGSLDVGETPSLDNAGAGNAEAGSGIQLRNGSAVVGGHVDPLLKRTNIIRGPRGKNRLMILGKVTGDEVPRAKEAVSSLVTPSLHPLTHTQLHGIFMKGKLKANVDGADVRRQALRRARELFLFFENSAPEISSKETHALKRWPRPSHGALRYIRQSVGRNEPFRVLRTSRNTSQGDISVGWNVANLASNHRQISCGGCEAKEEVWC